MFLRHPFCRLPLLLILTLFGKYSYAQLCNGSLGDPVVNITFGSGTNPGPPLNAATTNYTYVSNDCPNDGMYTIRNQTTSCFGNSWYTLTKDHTGDPNGYFMLVNASYTPSDFYLDKVSGLCPNTTYEFAAWVMNIINYDNSIKPNITFSIEKTDGSILGTYNTGDIPVSNFAEWKQYGFYFTTTADVSTIVLRMKNNAPGGIGNDIALDDITFRPCGPMVSASINGSKDTSVCAGDPTIYTLNSFVSSGYNAPVFQWQVSTDSGNTWKDIPNANSTSYQRLPTDPGTYLYRLSVAESGNGGLASCRIASNTIRIKVNSLPSITLQTNSPVCTGSDLQLNANISYASPGPWTFNWTYPDPATIINSNNVQNDNTTNKSVITQVIAKTTQANAGKYYLTARNSYGCTSVDSIIVVMNRKPSAGYSVASSICEQKAVQFTDQSTSIVPLTQWNWSFGEGGSSTGNNPIHTYSSANTYQTTLIVKDSNNCSDTLTKDIIVHPSPQPDFGLPEICLTDAYANFTDSSSISDNSTGAFSYIWNFGDPNATIFNPNTSSVKDPRHAYSAIGNYNIHLTVTSKDGCSRDTIKVFTVNGSVPVASFSVNNSSNLCSNDKVTITNNSTVNFGNIVRVEIYWDNANNQSLKTIDENPAPGKQYDFDYSGIVSKPSTNFTIRYVAYSGISCVNEINKTITVFKTPEVQFNSLSAVCQESPSFQITQASELLGITGSGTFSGDGISSTGLFNPTVAGAGNHLLQYTFTSDAGCKASIGQTIQVYPQPRVDAGPDKTVIRGKTTTLQASASGNNLSYSWTPVSFIDNATISSPKVSPPSDMTYTLQVKSAEGCTNIDSVSVKVLNGFYVPTGFTPNGDGLNDTWRLPYLDSYPDAEVWIFNRWGQSVYHSIGTNVSWDGTFNGKPQAAGTFVYLIDLKDGSPKLKGTIELIR
jgi:gliding motility-associated-like protein